MSSDQSEPVSYTTLLIHHVPELMEKTAALISEEWPRGLNARMLSLKASKDELPCDIILKTADDEVVAHCRLSLVSDDALGVLIETVVVAKHLRGQGLGKQIMFAAESHAKLIGKSTLYLSTHDKQKFYEHLGFVRGDPVTALGANASKFSSAQLSGLLGAFGGASAQANDSRTWMKKSLAHHTSENVIR